MADFIEQFKKEIAGFTPTERPTNTGVVLRVGDGVAEVEGLAGAGMSEMVRFDISSVNSLSKAIQHEGELFGMILNLEEESVRVIILGDVGLVREGMTVVPTGEVLSINVGDELLGRVVSPLGAELDGLGEIKTKQKNAIEREAYGVMSFATSSLLSLMARFFASSASASASEIFIAATCSA